MRLLKKIRDILGKRDRRSLLILAVVTFVLAFVEMASVFSILPFLSIAARPEQIHENAHLAAVYSFLGMESEKQALVVLAVVIMLVLIVSSVLQILVLIMQQSMIRSLNVSLSRQLMSRYLNARYEEMMLRNSADLQRNIQSELNVLTNKGILPVLIIGQRLLSVLMVGLIVFVSEPVPAVIALVVIAGAYAIQFGLIRRRVAAMAQESASTNERRFRAVNEAFAEQKLLSLHGVQQFFLERFSAPLEAFMRIHARLMVYQRAPKFVVEAFVFSGMILLAIVILLTRDAFAEAIPVLGFFAFAGYRLLPSVQIIYQNFAMMKAHQRRIEDVLGEFAGGVAGDAQDGVPGPALRSDISSAGRPEADVAIRLSGVTYAYPQADVCVLSNVSLEIKTNSSVGICGPTGVGKTTLIDIMLGLLQPREGRIEVFGMLLDDETVAWWRRQVAYVPQEVSLCDMSIAGNIAFGEECPDMERVREAASLARIAEFIDSLPEGYDSSVGEHGTRLSGGQRQRIGIARALYRRPSVLIFDEATSSLDHGTERAVMDAVNELAGQMTMIMIAHRLSTLEQCDYIYELQGAGKIVRRGYEELSQK